MAERIILLENQNLDTVETMVNGKLEELENLGCSIDHVSYFYGNKHVVMITYWPEEECEAVEEVVEEPDEEAVEEADKEVVEELAKVKEQVKVKETVKVKEPVEYISKDPEPVIEDVPETKDSN